MLQRYTTFLKQFDLKKQKKTVTIYHVLIIRSVNQSWREMEKKNTLRHRVPAGNKTLLGKERGF